MTEKLGTEKIGKLLLNLSTPAVIGMLAVSVYNLADTIFIARGVGTLALAGISVALPIQMLIAAAGMTIGVGAASIISRSLGAGNTEKAEEALGSLFFLVIITSAILTFFGVIFLDPLLRIFGTTNEIMSFASDYMGIMFWGAFFLAMAMASNNVIRAEGKAKIAMIVMTSGVVINIILDPIFIFVFGWGVKGAALATVFSHIISASIAFYYFFCGRGWLKVRLKNIRLNLAIAKETLKIGSSSFARQASGSLFAMVVNNSLAFYGGSLAIAAFGIINRALMFTVMPLFGIIQGAQPIIGFNYGAKKYDRVKQATYLSIKVATIIASTSFLILMFGVGWIVRLFTNDEELIPLAIKAIRLTVMMLPLIGFQVIVAGLYQSLGKARPALFLSILRTIILLVPLVLIMPLFFKLDGVWLAFPIADFLAAIITYFMLKKEMKLLKA